MSSVAPAADDRTVYPVEGQVGEDILQRWIVELLRPLLQRWYQEKGQLAFVGADQFIYYTQYDPHQRVCPDIYVLPGIAPDTSARSWKTWETQVVPSFALEIVSTNWEKDYFEAPEKHEQLGTKELVIFDPHYAERRDGQRFQRWSRSDAGELQLVERTDAVSLDSSVLGCALRVVGVGSKQRIRIALAKDSTVLFPTAEEAERQAKEAERQAKEAERQAKEAERQAKEAERQAKEAALARVAELEAELAKLRR